MPGSGQIAQLSRTQRIIQKVDDGKTNDDAVSNVKFHYNFLEVQNFKCK